MKFLQHWPAGWWFPTAIVIMLAWVNGTMP